MATSQAKRAVQLKTPLGADALLVSHFAAREQISRPFEFDLELISETENVDADKLLGVAVTLQFKLPGDAGVRYFNGFVTEFSQEDYEDRHHIYHATLRPWFWLLSRTSDCKIFQGKSVPDIFQAIVNQYKFPDFKLKLSGSYSPKNYCVQYRETDFNFLSRLLEQEGIHYFFEHQDGKHLMVLADDANAHGKIKGYETVPYYPPTTTAGQRERDHLESWAQKKSVESGAYSLTDYDYSAPKKSLLQTSSISKSHARSDFEIFDYPAELGVYDSGEASRVAKVRIQELQTAQTLSRGSGNAAGLATGHNFSLSKYPRSDLNIEYLIIDSNLTISADVHTSGATEGDVEFKINLEAIDAKIPYRPQRITPKPVVQGAQTAVVVGNGEEIYTDKYGNVKVQFPWDRHGKNDENSSCWIRVAQVWAGKQWGAMHIPRVGQEVIVSFLEGDPDQPIITGRVYNGANMPVYDLPANKTQSGIKSRSSKDGAAANFNEIRFEDLKGSEQVYIHAEKNQDNVVENDETTEVGHDRTEHVVHDEVINIDHDRTEKVGNNENISIGKDRNENVSNNETIGIGKDRNESVGGSETVSIAKGRTQSVGDNESIDVGQNQSITVGKDRTRSVAKNESITIGHDRREEVGKNEEIQIGENREHIIAKNDKLSVGKELIVEVADAITIKTGSASIEMKKDGTITIKGKDITLDGSGKINIKAGGDVIVKGSKIQQN